MKKITIDINTKWNILWRARSRAKSAKKKERLRSELFELLQYNAYINQFNHNNK